MLSTKSRAVGYHSLPHHTICKPHFSSNTPPPPFNGPIHIECTTMKNVPIAPWRRNWGHCLSTTNMGGALRISLHEMGNPQPPTPVVTNSAPRYGFVNENIVLCRFRTVYMRFCWFPYRFIQGQYLVYWRSGKKTFDNYFTENHLSKHHRSVRIT